MVVVWLSLQLHEKKFDAELLFTDTDNLTYERKSEDVYEEFFKHKHLVDFSNFSKDSKFYDSQNKIIAGKIKVKHKGIPINKFVWLKSKMYSIFSDDGKESNRAKGVNIATEFNAFKETVFNKTVIKQKMKRIWSKKHNLGTYEIIKHHYRVLMIEDLF